MDIVLELLDTLVLDRLYATLLPASAASSSSYFQTIKHATATAIANATFSSRREVPTTRMGVVDWIYHYQPASQYLQLEPSEWAYMSSWPRDSIFRQAISLFFITWCVLYAFNRIGIHG